jgi:hypothetical protein
MNEIISEWNTDDIKGLKISRNKEIKTLLFADDQVLMADSENLLQKIDSQIRNNNLTIWTNHFN